MKLKATVTSLDAVDAAHRDLYAETEEGSGIFALQVERTEVSINGQTQVWALEDIGGMKKVMESAKAGERTAKAALKKFDGIDPDEARQAIKTVSEGGGGDNKKVDEIVQSKVKQITDKHATEVSELKTQIAARDKQLEKVLIEDAVTRAMAKHQLIEGGDELLRPHVQKQLRIVRDENGENPHAVVVGDDGKERISLKPNCNDPMGVEELVDTLKTRKPYSHAFKGTGSQGIGSGENNNGRQAGGHEQNANTGGQGGSGAQGDTQHLTNEDPVSRLGRAFAPSQGA